MSDTDVRDAILKLIDKATGKTVPGTQPWPGLPVGQIGPLETPIALAMIRDGLIEQVSRPRAVDPTKTAHFYRRTV